MKEGNIARAQILIHQKRYKEADKLLADVLSQDPNNPYLLAQYSEVAIELDDLEKAEELINSAISIDPEEDVYYYIKARIRLQQNRYDDAEELLKKSISIAPEDADYFALSASIKLQRKQFEKALELSNKALEFDPENLTALNTRSTALLKLNRKEESFQSIDGALREDPNNPYTHSNFGWMLLEKGETEKALEHFKEALSNDPNYEYAQAGMMEALKGKHFIYRMFLKYAFWMSNLTEKYQWGVIIGFYIAFKALRSVAESNPTLSTYIIPVLVIMAVMAFSTWVIPPISNLFLRLNKYGKYLLNKKEMLSSNFVGGSIFVTVISSILYLITGLGTWLPLAAFAFSMMIPFSAMFTTTKRKHFLLYYTAALFVLGLIAAILPFFQDEILNTFSVIYLFGLVAFQWIANFMVIKSVN